MKLLLLSMAFAVTSSRALAQVNDPLSGWREGVKVHPVLPEAERHTMHSYFNTNPESPDSKWVLFYASKTSKGHTGDVCIYNRETHEEKMLAANVNVEDAHRVACQQWISGGKRVVYHGERDGHWYVACVDVATGEQRILAHDQLSCWGRPDADIVPLYGLHWNPGAHRNLELLNVVTGQVTTPVTVDALKAAYPGWWAKSFGDQWPSIFFPILSPDLKRVYFKMALAGKGDARSTAASSREGLICYSLEEKRFLYMNPKWGHPSWMPDSRHIVEAGNLVYDSNDGKYVKLPDIPQCHGDHPSVSPDGKLRVTDTTLEKFGGKDTEWGVVLADARGGSHVILHRFDNSQGARSWRRSHPHPVFSADGKRIYYNVSDGPWTRLFVAEASVPSTPAAAGPAR